MEYLPRLGLIGTITIVLAITKTSSLAPQVNRSIAVQLRRLAAERLRIRPRATIAAAIASPLTAMDRIRKECEQDITRLRTHSRDQSNRPSKTMVGRAWPTTADFAPFVSIKHSLLLSRPRSQSTDSSTVSALSTSGPIHRSSLLSPFFKRADRPQLLFALRVGRLAVSALFHL